MESVTLVHVHVKSEFREAFIAATHENRKNSILESGNLRFDFLQSPDDMDCFILYEVYADVNAARLHKDTAHYLKWRDTVAPMMAESRVGQAMIALAIK